jgi:hypothetical protein
VEVVHLVEQLITLLDLELEDLENRQELLLVATQLLH